MGAVEPATGGKLVGQMTGDILSQSRLKRKHILHVKHLTSRTIKRAFVSS